MRRLQKLSEDVYVFQPGNVTRYCIYARLADGGQRVAFMWLARGDVGGHGMMVHVEHDIDLSYFMEKAAIKNEPDAVAILCFLRETFGVKPAGIPEWYKDETWYRNGLQVVS
jgi:hypothetical protein